MRALLFLAVVLASACGNETPDVPDAGAADASPADAGGDVSTPTDGGTDVTTPVDAGADTSSPFTLTSSALAPGATFAQANTCKGVDESPPLAWTGAPGPTQSFAVTLTDKSNALVHWVLWDIPSSTSALPAALAKTANPTVPAGSKQAKSFDNSTFGYRGPCPPSLHTYTFEVLALDVATLPNVTTASTRAQVVTELGKHTLASATLTGTFAP